MMLERKILQNRDHWRTILKRLLHVVFFLSERGLPFRGDSCKIGDKHNGLFLGILEVIACYDSTLKGHLEKVLLSQEDNRREQVHYLSPQSQNEFIKECSEKVLTKIKLEVSDAKYYSIILDSTPDASHKEQTTFILRYVSACHGMTDADRVYDIQERFMTFMDFSQKKGEDIAEMALKQLKDWNIPFGDCRGQGYDNGSNMSGIHTGVQAVMRRDNEAALYSPCACHSLNLCGNNAAQCCPEVVTFFGMVQKLYVFFSASPQRWEILQKQLGSSLHGMSGTRWSERVTAVRPVAAHSNLILKAIEAAGNLTLTPEAATELESLRRYFSSFISVLMSSIWIKVLSAIDERNKILQTRAGTVDVEVENLRDLLCDLQSLRDQWSKIWNKAALVASGLDMPTKLPRTGKRQVKRKRFFDESPEQPKQQPQQQQQNDPADEPEVGEFRINVFYALIDSVILGLTTRFEAAERIDSLFGFLYKFQSLSEEDLTSAVTSFCEKYKNDVSEDLVEEMILLKKISRANLGVGDTQLSPLHLLNKLHETRLQSLFPNVCISLRIFCTLPVTVASAERSFSHLKRIKTYSRSTMAQERLQGLALLCVESEVAKTIDYDSIVDAFAARKDRKAAL